MAPRSDRKAKGDSPVVSRESELAAIDYGIIICSDGVYSDTANDISIGEIVRHCLRGSDISIRSISGNNTSSLCENASIHLHENVKWPNWDHFHISSMLNCENGTCLATSHFH